MKKIMHILPLFVISFISLSGSLCGMNPDHDQDLTLTDKQVYTPQFNKDTVTHIAGYSWPKQKNALMRTCKTLYAWLKDRIAILQANPNTISDADKIKDMITFARSGNIAMVRFLLSNGLAADCSNILGVTPFYVASQNNQIPVMQLLAQHGINVNYIPAIHPLHEAVYNGDVQKVQALLAMKIDPNLKINNNNATPLLISANKGKTEIAKLLIDAQANVNVLGFNNTSSLLIASKYNHIEIVKLLLAAQADVNQADNNGGTSLMVASQQGHTEIVQLLLAAQANVNLATNNGSTALMFAICKGNTEIVKLLLAAQADVNQAHNQGLTPLIAASQLGHAEIVQLLLAAQAQVNQADNNGGTPLMTAAYHGHTEIVQLLLAAQADVNQATNEGWTALPCASYKGYIEIVKLLLSYGADKNKALTHDSRIDPLIKKGDTALQIAQKKGYAQIVELLY